MFPRILVPTDFSPQSDAALEYARALAEKFGSSLHLLHVLQDPFVSGPLGSELYVGETEGMRKALMDDAEGRVRTRLTAQDRARFGATTEVVVGSGARTIVEYADAKGISLIVMGTHGRTGLAHAFMGSVAERVVRTASCPVLTIREAPVRARAPITATAAATA